jgi:hypothetical protein
MIFPPLVFPGIEVCAVQPVASAVRSFGAMQQAAMAACIIFKYLHITEEHFACGAKWHHAVKSVAYTSRGI